MELNQAERKPIVQKCIGCSKVTLYDVEGNKIKGCRVYLFPQSKWRSGNCPLADHLEKKEEKEKSSHIRRKFGRKKHR